MGKYLAYMGKYWASTLQSAKLYIDLTYNLGFEVKLAYYCVTNEDN